MTDLQRYLVEEIALDHADGLITRREALRRLALVGLGVSAASSLLAASFTAIGTSVAQADDAAPSAEPTVTASPEPTASTTSTPEPAESDAPEPEPTGESSVAPGLGSGLIGGES